MKTRILSAILLLAVLFSACENARKKPAPQPEGPKPFPAVTIPAMYDTEENRASYLVEHFWDLFFGEGGVTDSVTILGVEKAEVEQAFSNYTLLLSKVPMKEAQKGMSGLFDKIESVQASDTSRLNYLQLTELVSRYLYDPNSPMRNEDYYLPFVRKMASSKYTSDDLKAAYKYETEMCSINQYGTKVANINYKTVAGRRGSLYALKSDYTILFFSNPGCTACKTIVEELRSRPYLDKWIVDGRLSVLNLYIDEEVDEWRQYVPNYPSSWTCGYDYTFSIRDNGDYNVRAIPSLYLLDEDKRVLFKDAPTLQVLKYLDNLNNNL